MTRLFAALAAGAALTAAATPAGAVDLKAVEIGRFAWFLDRDSVVRTGDGVSLRALMVTPEDFEAGGKPYWGGWSHLDIDCRARTVDETGFQSVQVGGAEGPKTADNRPGWPIAPGSRDAALADAACDGRFAVDRPATADVAEAVRWGRAWLAE